MAGMKAKFADYIFLLRPMILIPVWTFYLLGAHHAVSPLGRPIARQPFLIGIVSFTALLGAVYIMNQVADRAVDLARNKLFLIPRGIISTTAAWVECVALVAVAFVLGLAFLPLGFSLILALGLALGAAYSLEPIRLKRRPLVDVLSNAVGNGVLNTLAGWVASGAPLHGWIVLAPYPLAVASVHLTTTLGDREADAREGLRTSGVVMGKRLGLMTATVLMGIAAAAAQAVGNRPALIASLVALPFFLVPGRFAREPEAGADPLLPAKMATVIFSVAAGFLFPLYLPSLVVLVLLTRLYYRRRFDIDYPALRA
jgi:4-hydroxybenzoate polyprenyltransferase